MQTASCPQRRSAACGAALCEAPNAEAVKRIHERAGHPVDQVYEVPVQAQHPAGLTSTLGVGAGSQPFGSQRLARAQPGMPLLWGSPVPF